MRDVKITLTIMLRSLMMRQGLTALHYQCQTSVNTQALFNVNE